MILLPNNTPPWWLENINVQEGISTIVLGFLLQVIISDTSSSIIVAPLYANILLIDDFIIFCTLIELLVISGFHLQLLFSITTPPIIHTTFCTSTAYLLYNYWVLFRLTLPFPFSSMQLRSSRWSYCQSRKRRICCYICYW